jgi:hypothetical protein
VVAVVVVLALGLGYVVANARQDRTEVTDRREGSRRHRAA